MRVAGNTYAWSLALPSGDQCREEWRFGVDGVLTIVSGQEVTTNTYALAALPNESMLRLDRKRLTSNGLADCQGNTNASVGQSRGLYLQFLNDGGFFTCSSTNGLSCYGVATPLSPR